LTTSRPLDGVLVVDKPSGPTSHDVVACARRALHVNKVGHLGTLDPLATGVLPLVVGRATRLASLFTGASKQYDAVIRLGVITDTYDITGTVLGGSEATAAGTHEQLPSPDAISAAARGFIGSHLQRPPPVSAKKIGGVRAYELARRHQPVEIPPVPVTIDALTVLSIDGPRVRCRIVSSSGFYVRSLAHELGGMLGCGGCLEALRRERHGPFRLEQAVQLAEVVEDGAAAGARLVPMEALLPEMTTVVVSNAGALRARHGNPLRPDDLTPPVASRSNTDRVRVLDPHGSLLAIAVRAADGALHPRIVLV
jgi:tRNA pseudouridine55 synthase